MFNRKKKEDQLTKEKLQELREKTLLNKIEIAGLIERFKEVAKNGVLNQKNFRKVFDEIGSSTNEQLVDRLFKYFDKDKNGTIDLTEFLLSMAVILKGTKEQKLRICFSLYDENGDGKISKDELKKVLKMQLSSVAMINQLDNNEPHNRDIDAKEIDNLASEAFLKHDTHKSGVITFEEFAKWAGEHEKLVDILDIMD